MEHLFQLVTRGVYELFCEQSVRMYGQEKRYVFKDHEISQKQDTIATDLKIPTKGRQQSSLFHVKTLKG